MTDGDNRDLIAALAGKQAERDQAVAEHTRRIVTASLGVMQDQKNGRQRVRSLALASIVLVFVALGPLVWRIAEDIVAGDFVSDTTLQTSLWASLLCSATLAAVLVAGWSRKKH